MTTIVTRAGKGAPLLNSEVDSNFTNLNTDKVEKSGTDPIVISVSSASDALRITQTGAGNALVVEDSTNPDATPFVVNTSGHVVIGNTAALISGSGIGPIFQTHGLSNNTSAVGFTDWQATAFGGPFVVLSKSRSGDIGTNTILQAGDRLGILSWCGDDGTKFVPAAEIVASVDGTPGLNDMPGRLVFSTTADGASSNTERMRIDSTGSVGIGGSGGAAYTLRASKNITGATTIYNVSNEGTIQSDVTGTANLFYGAGRTAASAFTLANLRYFTADQGAIGAGSTVTSQFGFSANASIVGATNNYGFYSNIASGTGRWNFYAAGTADNYFAGAVGVGTPPAPGSALYVQKVVVGSGGYSDGIRSTAISDPATTTYQLSSFSSVPGVTASSSFSQLIHYWAFQNAFGAGASVTNQYGFQVSSSLTGATNNYGVYSAIASGTGRYNFYAAGSAPNYFAGAVGINGIAQQGYFEVFGDGETAGIRASTASGNATFGVRANDFSSGPSYRAVLISQYCASATGTTMGMPNANLSRILFQNCSNAAIFTNGQSKLSFGTYGTESLYIDGGQSVWSVATGSGTNGYGFGVSSAKTGATNNFGFYSSIPSGTGRYNFYAAGSANSYLNGTTIHGTSPTVITSSSGVQGALQVNSASGVTALNIGCYVNANSGNAIYASKSRSGTVGVATAGAVTSGDSLFGVFMDASDGTNQIRGASLSFSVNGTVGTNIIPTQMTIQTMTAGGALNTALTIDNAQNIYGTSGTTGMGSGFFYIPSAAGAPSGTPTAVSGRVPMYYDTTNNKFYIYNGAWKSVTLA